MFGRLFTDIAKEAYHLVNCSHNISVFRVSLVGSTIIEEVQIEAQHIWWDFAAPQLLKSSLRQLLSNFKGLDYTIRSYQLISNQFAAVLRHNKHKKNIKGNKLELLSVNFPKVTKVMSIFFEYSGTIYSFCQY